MPFVSTKQRGFMHAEHPDIAARWDKLTPKGEKLPRYVHGKSSSPKLARQFSRKSSRR